MKQQILSNEMIELLSAFKSIEIECNHSKEMTWAKIYLLGFEMGKQEGIRSLMNAQEVTMKFKELNPEQRAIVKNKMKELLEVQNKIKGNRR